MKTIREMANSPILVLFVVTVLTTVLLGSIGG